MKQTTKNLRTARVLAGVRYVLVLSADIYVCTKLLVTTERILIKFGNVSFV